MNKKALGKPCPCGRPATLARCCAPLIAGQRHADTAEALMRSRYSAYVLGAADYLCATWHASTRPATLDLTDSPRWIGLQVLAAPPADGERATVEFDARYRVHGRACHLHELSRFVREDGRWYYVDGAIQPD